MRLIEFLMEMIPRYTRINKTEAQILNIAITKKGGNAYSLWKASGLKHYPTVLRVLKKLEEKSLVEVLDETGMRGERVYVPTLMGKFVSYTFNGEEKKILKTISENSNLFQEYYEIEPDDYRAFAVVQDMIWDIYRKKKKLHSIDDLVKSNVGLVVADHLDNILDEGASEWITKVSKVKWIRQFTIKEIEYRISRAKKEVMKLKQLKETLTAMYD